MKRGMSGIVMGVVVLVLIILGLVYFFSENKSPSSDSDASAQNANQAQQEEASSNTQNANQATAPSSGSQPATHQVSIQNFAFSPSQLSIKSGDTVVFINKDSSAHTATASGTFDSDRLEQGDTFSFTFSSAGAFDYLCTIHPSMKGKIIVS